MVSPLFPLTVTAAIVVRRGKRLLGPVDRVFGAEGVSIVMGPNGSGKTTLLRSLHGLERLTSGQVAWNVDEDTARRRQAFVLQTPVMMRRSVQGNLALPMELQGAPRARIRAETERWADLIGLGDALARPAKRLSGGEKQKLALARALILGPDVVFLDEPCANLDGRSTREIETILTGAAKRGTRIIMATHDLGQARRLATEILFMLNGRIHEEGDAAHIFSQAKTPETAAFLNGDIVE